MNNRLLGTLAAAHVLGALTSCSNVGTSTQAPPPDGSGAEQEGARPAANAPGASRDGALPVEPSPNGEAPLTPELPLNAAPSAPGSGTVTRFLSDTCARSEQNGWGPIERDLSNGEDSAADGGPLSLGGVLYAKGLGTHAPSDAVFALDGSCSRFSALAGVDNEMKRAGSVQFQVLGECCTLEHGCTETVAPPSQTRGYYAAHLRARAKGAI